MRALSGASGIYPALNPGIGCGYYVVTLAIAADWILVAGKTADIVLLIRSLTPGRAKLKRNVV